MDLGRGQEPAGGPACAFRSRTGRPGCAAGPDRCATGVLGGRPVSAGGPSGRADLPADVGLSVSAGHRRPVTHLRGGCHVARVRPGRRSRDAQLPAVADKNRYRASGSGEHRDAGQLCASVGAVAWRARAAARPRTKGPKAWLRHCLAEPAPCARPAAPPRHASYARGAAQLPRCFWQAASPERQPAALSRRLARTAPRFAGRHHHVGLMVSFPAGHGNLRMCASARLLPLAGHLNHRGGCGKRPGRLEIPLTPPRSFNVFRTLQRQLFLPSSGHHQILVSGPR